MNQNIMRQLILFFEKKAFGVCAKIAEVLGISSNVIRLYFIYLSFITFGSPIIVYLGLAFLMNLKRYLRRNRIVLDTF
ncbi:PspC domain-containing protein [Rapidithrix thailandica]|uniref:PspC domain-containing protein n=1 Tax=Rapidithrix thailandica TaxID=413964 RepID=A0AAW9S6R9_9BACT